MTWSESVDQALCYGWIDGIRRSIDEQSYSIRFTPRRVTSNWSDVNLKKMAVLKKKGLVKKAGLDIFAKRKSKGASKRPKEPTSFSSDLQEKFASKRAAWSFFASQSASYQKLMLGGVMSAKKDSTRLRRLEKLIEASLKSERLQ